MADFIDINYQLLENKINIDLIRIAFHKKDLTKALESCKIIKDLGYNVSVNAMAITNYNNYELKDFHKLIELMPTTSNLSILFLELTKKIGLGFI